ncbi:MAG: hypothetical protein QOH70_2243 [Blastocatellia bacterium]|jgi:hypothetical protein|nr:hypothetical protein [Blastocatellia bacterium]
MQRDSAIGRPTRALTLIAVSDAENSKRFQQVIERPVPKLGKESQKKPHRESRQAG